MKSIRIFAPILFLSVLFNACTPPAKEEPIEEEKVPSFSIVEQHEAIWQEAIAQLIEMADAMPVEQYDYKPHDSLRSFAGQLAHIASSSQVVANLFLKDIRPDGPPETPDVTGISKEDLKSMINEGLNGTWNIIKTMSDEQLLTETTTSFAGNTMTRLEGLIIVHDHLTNHKAKANLYIRTSGNEPPRYRYY